jgi:sugar phosphate isomerase/epimerase
VKFGDPMKTEVDLLASYWTFAGGALPHSNREYNTFDFEDRVQAIAKAGFTGMGIWHADLDHLLTRRSLPEMKRILDDHGIRHVEIEFLTDWFLDGERKEKSDFQKRKLLAAAEALHAHHVKVGDFYHEKFSMSRLIESFAALCADAAKHGMKIGFEVMPFAMIDTLKDSLAMVRGAGAKNGGIAFDVWHLAKMRVPFEELQKFPPEFLVSVELNDGTFQAPWSLHEDTVNHRRFCGEGEFDVKSFVKVFQELGYRGPWGIEVLSEDVRNWPLEKVTTHAYQTTMRQFQS